MHSLAGTYLPSRITFIHLHHIVHKDSGSIHYYFRFDLIFFPVKCVDSMHPIYFPGGIFQQTIHLHIIQAHSTFINSGQCQRYSHARIIKLPVMIYHSTSQSFML